mmetsp:Transcript_4438/g.7443  ORF Transcript_4438/g.7443 Transcript_4438/m.7443 type:complete len:202 (-) Transcript_4438:344-949(-)
MTTSPFSPHGLCSYIVLLNHLILFVSARRSGGGSYYQGRTSSTSRGRFFPVWFPHRSYHNSRQCDDDDVDCQEAGSVGWLDVFLLILMGVGVLACCFLCAYNRQQRSATTDHDTSTTTNQDYNRYVSMRGEQGNVPYTMANQQCNQYVASGVGQGLVPGHEHTTTTVHRAFVASNHQTPVVVQGQHVEMVPTKQRQESTIV